MAKFDRKLLARTMPALLEKASEAQAPLAAGYVRRLRDNRPDATPADVIAQMEGHYLTAVTSGGAAAGATAAAPLVGTGPALLVNLAEVGWFLNTTVLYVLALADVHKLGVNDPERRRTLLLAVITGNGLSGTVEKIAGRTGPHIAREIITKIPISNIHAINRILGKNFVTKYGTKQGVLVLGRELPLGLGAVIGGGGNAALGYLTIRTARHVFGVPPDSWPASGTAPRAPIAPIDPSGQSAAPDAADSATSTA